MCVCRPTDPRAHGESSNVKSVLVLAVHYRAFWFWLYITERSVFGYTLQSVLVLAVHYRAFWFWLYITYGEDYTLALVMELANVLLMCC